MTIMNSACIGFLERLAAAFLLGVTLTACVSSPSESHGASPSDLQNRFISAAQAGEFGEAAEALMTLAERSPDQLSALGGQADTARLVLRTLRSAEPAARYRLSTTLFNRRWLLPNGFQPSETWSDLALVELERGNMRRAAEVAARIPDPADILIMRIDKRFEPLLRAHPEQFDLIAATDRYLAWLDDMCTKFPRTLSYRVEQLYVMTSAGRAADAVARADEVLARTPNLDAARLSYDDGGERFNWLLDYRGQALERLGIWQEAEKNRKRAAQLLEEGRPNVSNAINLAGFYAALGRSRDAYYALGAMATSREGTSPYGRMQVDAVLLMIAVTDGDDLRAKEVLDRMRQNQAAAPSTFEAALLLSNQIDEAAALLIRRLRDPEMRRMALIDVQAYSDEAVSPYDRLMEERWALLRTRQDVIDAVAPVGRIERVPRPRPSS
jgi:beta-barrel assembly-enhancing protease